MPTLLYGLECFELTTVRWGNFERVGNIEQKKTMI